jgi:hypothetical protein
MRICKRCKVGETIKGSLNCKKCNEYNEKKTKNIIANLIVEKQNTTNLRVPVYGGLGCEWDKGVAGHLENL